MYTETYAGNSTLPSVAQAKTAFKLADAEPKYRDTRKLMYYLQDVAETDGIIRNLIRMRRVGVNSFGWQIVAADDKFDDAAKNAEIRCRDLIKNTLKYHTDTPMFGAIAIEYAYERVGSEFVPNIIKRYKPVEIERDDNPADIRIMPEGDKYARFNVEDSTRDNWIIDIDESLKPGGTLRSILIRMILAKDMEVEWANYNKAVKGIIQAVVGDATSKEDVEGAEAALQNLMQRKYAITDELTEFKHNELVSPIGATSFKDFLERLYKIFSHTIIGNANITELPNYGGSRAALWVLKTITADIIFEDIMRCENMINDQLLLSDYRTNYKREAKEAPWRFKFIIPEEIDLEKRVAVIEGCQRAGIPLKTEEVYNTLEFTKPDDAPDIMFAKPDDDNPVEFDEGGEL